jgi:hypothetical protein
MAVTISQDLLVAPCQGNGWAGPGIYGSSMSGKLLGSVPDMLSLLWPVDQFGECRCGDVEQVTVFSRAET